MALIHVDFFSEALEMSTQVEVVLPVAAGGQIGISDAGKRNTYPVLYLLHGMTDNHTTWQRNTSIERYAVEKGIAVVMPGTRLGWYTDMKYGYRYFTHVCQEVPDVCRRFFPCLSDRREDNFVAGNSMGGYGAFKLALRAPERFCAAASLSGVMDVYENTTKRHTSGPWPTYWEDIFGTPEELKGSENDLYGLVDRFGQKGQPRPKLYMWCGTEDGLYSQNTAMREHLKEMGWDLRYKETPGDQSWKYWDREIRSVLEWLPAGEKEEA